MRLISVNVGKPREIGKRRGVAVESGIFKEPVIGPVAVHRYNLEGDVQADLTVHGGKDAAVYIYPSEHYEYWREKFPKRELPWGSFGENLTTEGLLENQVRVGDRLLIGSAEFAVTKPRLPCFKLGIKFGTQKMLGWFLESEFTGFYLEVQQEGQIQAGDRITMISTRVDSSTIAAIVQGVKRRPGSIDE
jgi:MOSC domain-containing protein YiiM